MSENTIPNPGDEAPSHDDLQKIVAHNSWGLHGLLDFEGMEPVLHHLIAQVREYAESLGCRPEDLLYSGINPDQAKPPAGEHRYDGERHVFFMGNFRSLLPPTELSSDEEMQGEHWVVNPLKFAIEGGALAMYDPEALAANPALEHFDMWDEATEEAQFGTATVVARQEDMVAAELSRLPIEI